MTTTRMQKSGMRAVLAALAVLAGGCTTMGVDEDQHLQCTTGFSRCEGNTPQSCMNGAWQDQAPCVSQTCMGGTCTGVCGSNDTQCSGNTPQACNGDGQWQNGAACASPLEACNVGVCVPGPNCAGLLSTCGAGGDESCCASTVVMGGTYNRSNDSSYPAAVSEFRLDRFEVTAGRFRAFVAAYPGSKPALGAGAHPLIAGSGWDPAWDGWLPGAQATLKAAVKCDSTYQTWTDAAGPNENLPMNCITWYEAFSFCAWDGGRLPTEAEWNYAAAGGSEQREYPWSTPPSSMLIDSSYAVYDGTVIVGVGSKSPRGAGKWLQADLAGSMMEWNLDRYGTYASLCHDCANVVGGGMVIRGGSWNVGASDLLSSGRYGMSPFWSNFYIGFRCARTP